MILTSSFPELGPRFFRNSATIPSSPHALLFLSFFICLIISSSVGGVESSCCGLALLLKELLLVLDSSVDFQNI